MCAYHGGLDIILCGLKNRRKLGLPSIDQQRQRAGSWPEQGAGESGPLPAAATNETDADASI